MVLQLYCGLVAFGRVELCVCVFLYYLALFTFFALAVKANLAQLTINVVIAELTN